MHTESKRQGRHVAGPLKNKQWELFANLVDQNGNALKSALGANYSARTAKSQGSRLLTRVDVAQRVAELRTERLKNIGIDASWVLQELASMFDAIPSEILEADGVTLKNIHDWPRHWQKMIHSFEIGKYVTTDDKGNKVVTNYIKKLKWIDKHKVIQDMGRHTDVQAFQDRLKVDVPQFADFVEALNTPSKGKPK